MRAPSYTSLDDALEALAPFGTELKNGNSNHAPMVAEALCAMGRPDAVMPWITRYRQRMLPRSRARDRISRENWLGALGQRGRFTEWAGFFGEELQEAPWHEVLDHWVGRLAPGFSAAATHGVIRVGHAARSLGVTETPYRLRELADALASWAATYQELPVSGRIANGMMRPRDAITKVAAVPPDARRSGNITASLAALSDFPEFVPTIGLIDVGGDIAPLLSELTEVFARVFLANARDALTTIVFIHGVTSLAALGSIVAQVSEATARSALPYAWQSGCGLYACFGSGTAMAQKTELPEEDDESFVDRAIANGDEHVIKFTEACLRRYALSPSPTYFAAIDRTLSAMPTR
jgi:Questin oxidase-like